MGTFPSELMASLIMIEASRKQRRASSMGRGRAGVKWETCRIKGDHGILRHFGISVSFLGRLLMEGEITAKEGLLTRRCRGLLGGGAWGC